ncbi:MAG: type II toxin-antitoxin system RelE/ParE family toxin [Sulfuricurvum sp.]
MKLRLFKSNQFKRSFKKLQLCDSEEQAFIDVAYKLLSGIDLEEKYRDHFLKGEYASYKECHIKPNLLLIYGIEDDSLRLIDIGTHSELFD